MVFVVAVAVFFWHLWFVLASVEARHLVVEYALELDRQHSILASWDLIWKGHSRSVLLLDIADVLCLHGLLVLVGIGDNRSLLDLDVSAV